jgi:hypothetical protein
MTTKELIKHLQINKDYLKKTIKLPKEIEEEVKRIKNKRKDK